MAFQSRMGSVLAALFMFLTMCFAGNLVEVKDFGANPGKTGMYIYVPDKVAPNPPVLVAMHGCYMTAQLYFVASKYPSLAEKRGFIIIWPNAGRDERCFDVGTPESLKHGGQGETTSIVNMVKYTLQKYNGDAKRVFATGISSGGMMTTTICAVYPDVFAAGSSFSGIPSGCLAGSPGFGPMSADPTCADGRKILSAQEWATRAKSYFPGYTGAYPRMQVWHGTADPLVKYPNFGETLKQWSALLDVQWTKNETDVPSRGFTKMDYGDGTKLQGYSLLNGGHPLSGSEETVLDFFGI